MAQSLCIFYAILAKKKKNMIMAKINHFTVHASTLIIHCRSKTEDGKD
jgi:hypothetical protein